MQAGSGDEEHQEDCGKLCDWPASIAEDEKEPEESGGVSYKDWSLVMTGEPGESQEEAAAGGAECGLDSAGGSQQEEENQRGPDDSVDHLRPIDVAYVAAEGEEASSEDGGDAGAAQVLCQQEAVQGGDEVDEDEIGIQIERPQVSIFKAGVEEQPVERVDCAGLGLADKGLASPKVGIPGGEVAGVPLASLFIPPREDLTREVGGIEPCVLKEESELPVEEPTSHACTPIAGFFFSSKNTHTAIFRVLPSASTSSLR